MMKERLISLFPGMQVRTGVHEKEVFVTGSVLGLPVKYLLETLDADTELNSQRINAFSEAVKEADASKGYLLHQHRLNKKLRIAAEDIGIELLSLEELLSDDFTLTPQVPVRIFSRL